MTEDELFAAASELPETQLRALTLRLQGLCSLGKGGKQKAAERGSSQAGGRADSILYDVLSKELSGISAPYARFLEAKNGSKFLEVEETLLTWLLPLLPDRGPVTVRAALTWLVRSIIVPRLHKFKNMWEGLFTLIADCPRLTEQSFPGYTPALLRAVFQTKLKGENHVRLSPSA